jgi:hypothetical protein
VFNANLCGAKIKKFPSSNIIISLCCSRDHLCGLVVGVPGYRSGGLGSIPGATRFSE